jgi:hypothetical protein
MFERVRSRLSGVRDWGAHWVVPLPDMTWAVKVVARAIVAWVARHPRVTLVGGALFVLIAPLLQDLYYIIPWWTRKRFGWAAFGVVVAIVFSRLLMVRQDDDPPPDEIEPARGIHRLWPFLLAAICLSMAWPMLRTPDCLGFGDWDLFLGKIEAARKVYAEYHQFPWWDPWTRGGFPLAANPQCGYIGVAMPFVLAFGATRGMGLGTVICFALAGEGARRLARQWLGDPVASFAVGLIYAINGAMLVAAVAAYHVSMCYPALSWMLYHVFRMHRQKRLGGWLGFWAAFSMLNGIQYFTVYMALIAGVVWLRALRCRTDQERSKLIGGTIVAVGMFLMLAGWRIATTIVVYRDFPRPLASGQDEGLAQVLRHLLYRRSAEFLRGMEIPYFWETTCYLGPVVLALGLASLAWGWRWWHTLTLVCVVLAIGSAQWYHPSYWLSHLPVFSTMHVVTRWRFMAILGVALASGGTLAALRRSDWPWLRALAPLAIAYIAFDYVSYGFEVLPVAFSVPNTEDKYPGPPLPKGEIVNVQMALGYPAISRGYGIVQGYEPLMGYQRGTPTERRWRGHPDYKGEFWTEDGPVEPTEWTPSRVVLDVKPFQEVFLNENPGSYWLVNGKRSFPKARVAEKEWVFSARANDKGRVVAQIAPRGLNEGLVLHFVGLFLIFAVALWDCIVGDGRRKGTEPG